jgi:hypothetical protein
MKEQIYEKKYIYEFDLKNFFGSVNVNKITEILINMGIPKKTCYDIENLNRCLPKLPKELLLDESAIERRRQEEDDIKYGREDLRHSMYKSIMEFHRESPDLLRQFMKEDGCTSIQEYLQLQ